MSRESWHTTGVVVNYCTHLSLIPSCLTNPNYICSHVDFRNPNIHHEVTWCTIDAHHAPPSVRNPTLHPPACSLSYSEHINISETIFAVLLFLSLSIFSTSYSFCVSSASALAVEERARQLQMKVHSYRPSASHDPESDLKAKREVSVLVFQSSFRFPPPALVKCLFFFLYDQFGQKSFISHLSVSVCRCMQNRGVAVTTCRPDHQTVIWATCRPSPVPAVPPASVALATCLSNQNDPGEDSGQPSFGHMFSLSFMGVHILFTVIRSHPVSPLFW